MRWTYEGYGAIPFEWISKLKEIQILNCSIIREKTNASCPNCSLVQSRQTQREQLEWSQYIISLFQNDANRYCFVAVAIATEFSSSLALQ